ncbi:response regulator transcription factor [Myxococcota bacterium]|nr:response regulator transcription factor [Myxococcota bacterium]MCZ7619281.1 response regulator transcription factor [Myxococcota bacterium]
MRILLLEDDPATADAIRVSLEAERHEVTHALGIADGIEFARRYPPDIAILDLMVPGGSGYEVLDLLRRRQPCPPILILTARDGIADRVAGLDRGADDYLIKPFSLAELAARVRAFERRIHASADRLQRGELAIDLKARRACFGVVELDLTTIEFELLACLAREGGAVVARTQLLRQVWELDFDPGTNVVEVHVHRLRRKIESAGGEDFLRTIRGRGYALG